MALPLKKFVQQLTKLFGGGATPAIDGKILGMSNNGTYLSAVNMRPNGDSGDKGVVSKIKGEELLYPSEDNSCVGFYGGNFDTGDWFCLATAYIKNNKVECWADRNFVLAPFIRINGLISAASFGLPIDTAHPLQIHYDENCPGGDLFMTDFNTPPLILDTQDIINNSGYPVCSEKYFNEFRRERYEINARMPAHHLTFYELANYAGYPATQIFGSGGLKVGQYAYSHRYTDDIGNKTNWAPATPLIPVPYQLDYRSDQYPGIKTYGAEPATVSANGIVLRLRVDNNQGYKYVEIKRWAYNTGAAIGYTPSAEIIGTVPIADNQLSVITVVDYGATGEPITDEDDTTQSWFINSAKAVRYINNVLTLANIKYADTQFDPKYVVNGRPDMFPVIQNITKVGHDDPYYGTYYRSLQRGEIYGYSVGFYDTLMTRTFAKPVTGYEAYQMPERRDDASIYTSTFSYDGIPEAVTYTSNSVHKCHEVYDLEDAVTKDNCCSFINISCNGSKGNAGLCANVGQGVNDFPASCGSCATVSTPYHAEDIGLKVLTPTGDSDGDVSGQNYRVNTNVENVGNNNFTDYHPKGFAPTYYSLGFALNGLDLTSIPSYIQAFSILRTAPAGRVVCQGIGIYYLYPANTGNFDPCQKALDQFWFYSDQSAAWTGLMSPGKIADINANPNSRYMAQLVSPVGFFTEMPWGATANNDRDTSDIVITPRFYKDETTINTSPDPVDGATYPWIQFGKWRNDTFPGWVTGLAGNKAMFKVNTFRMANNNGTDNTNNGQEYIGDRGGEYMVLQVAQLSGADVYVTGGVNNNRYDDQDLKNFHEPMYNVNIIDTLATVPQTNPQLYYDTGSYVKIYSKIAYASGVQSTQYPLVDERWEDCRPYTPNTYNGTATSIDSNTINSLVRLVFADGHTEYWLNADGVSQSDIDSLESQLPYTIATGSKAGYTISGFFRTTSVLVQGLNRFYSVVFDVQTTGGYQWLPAVNTEIYIDYDNEVPVASYGGQIWLGESIFAPIDRKLADGGGTNNHAVAATTEGPFQMDLGFPYYEMQINPRLYMLNEAKQNTNIIQDCGVIDLDWIRQMVCVFNCESPIHLPYNYEGGKLETFQFQKYYPATNYIERPIKWDTDLDNNFCGNKGNVYDSYKSVYPGEQFIWRYGGYRYRPRFNVDYMHVNNMISWTSQPSNYVPKTEFCTRAIWSLPRNIASSDSPQLRTFLPQNHYDFDDATGEIKFAWSASTGRGDNLYFLTNRGIVLAITQKTLLRDATGEQIALTKSLDSTNFISDQFWLNRSIGMNNEMWRSKAEFNNSLYFTNLMSAYRLTNDTIEDIGNKLFHNRLYDVLSRINGNYNPPAGDGSWITGFYDTRYKEYVVQIEVLGDGQFVSNWCYAYKEENGLWNDRYSYMYDCYLSIDNKTWGMGNRYYKNGQAPAQTYTLDVGYTIGGNPVVSEVVMPFTPVPTDDPKQFWAWDISSYDDSNNPEKPTRVEFYDDITQEQNGQVQSLSTSASMRDYAVFEQYINRRLTNSNRMQNQQILMKIVHNLARGFRVKSASVWYSSLFGKDPK